MVWFLAYLAIGSLYGGSYWCYLHSFEFWKRITEQHPSLNEQFKYVRSQGYLDTILLASACLMGLCWIVFIFFDLKNFVCSFLQTEE